MGSSDGGAKWSIGGGNLCSTRVLARHVLDVERRFHYVVSNCSSGYDQSARIRSYDHNVQIPLVSIRYAFVLHHAVKSATNRKSCPAVHNNTT